MIVVVCLHFLMLTDLSRDKEKPSAGPGMMNARKPAHEIQVVFQPKTIPTSSMPATSDTICSSTSPTILFLSLLLRRGFDHSTVQYILIYIIDNYLSRFEVECQWCPCPDWYWKWFPLLWSYARWNGLTQWMSGPDQAHSLCYSPSHRNMRPTAASDFAIFWPRMWMMRRLSLVKFKGVKHLRSWLR